MKIDETFNKYFQGCTARLPDHEEPIANLQNVCKLKLSKRKLIFKYILFLCLKSSHTGKGDQIHFHFGPKVTGLQCIHHFGKSYFSFVKPVQCGPSQGSHSHAHVVATEPGKVWCSSCRASPALGCFLCSVSGTFLVPHHSHVSLWHFRSCSQFSCAVGFIAHQLCTLVVSTSCAH